MAASKASCYKFLFLCIFLNGVYAELFSTMLGLQHVLKVEQVLARDLRSYIAKEKVRLQALENIANTYQEHSDGAFNQDTEEFLGNPLNAFLLVKRFTTDWEQVEELIKNNTSQDFLSSISGTLNTLPTDVDLKGAGKAIHRLQDTYALGTSSLANGEINQDIKTTTKLSAGDCFSLGQIAYNANDFYHTMLWMEESLRKLVNETEPAVERTLVLDYLSFATYEQGNTEQALQYTDEWLQLQPDAERAQNNKAFYEKTLSGQIIDDDAPVKNERSLKGWRKSHEFTDYERLCRGEEVIANPHKHKLKCRFVSHHPFFMYSPLKEEQMYLDPGVWVYHDLMTNKEINKIKELALPKLHTSGVFLNQDGSSSDLSFRTSKTAWLEDNLDPIIKRVSLRTAAMANLTLDHAESLQVLNYGMGGHYEPHWDFARDVEQSDIDLEGNGNRIATAIYYLSDVDAGGATVFNRLGVRAVPEKGSVTLWYNLLRNGKGDFRTQHAGCPVLSGFKWACNKWFHERAQDFLRPCTLDPNE